MYQIGISGTYNILYLFKTLHLKKKNHGYNIYYIIYLFNNNK